MYEEFLFKDGRAFVELARKKVAVSHRANPMVGWDGAINYVNLAQDLLLIYQLEKDGEAWNVCAMHMLLWGVQDTLRKDICRISKFWHPKANAHWDERDVALWHASVIYGGRTEMNFAVTNAWQEENFAKYTNGGNFEMTFAGIGSWMECLNGKSRIRFYSGNPVEMARRERNDPTIDHEDMDMSELRSLNSVWSDSERPARAEFTGVVESCRMGKICGEKCYRLKLWSGPAGEKASFPWNLLIAASRIDGHYVPRVGDTVHGNAFMFGTFHGEPQEEPTVYLDRDLLDPAETGEEVAEDSATESTDVGMEDGESGGDESHDAGVDIKEDWEYLPRDPAPYLDVEDHGGGLDSSVAEALPKYVVYGDYRKAMRGTLIQLKSPSRKELKRILDSIDYEIASEGRRLFAEVFESIGIRHFVKDEETNERHLWCCLPSGFGREHFHTNLLVALDGNGEVLRYTFYMGAWDWRRLDRGLDLQINFQSRNELKHYPRMTEAVNEIGTMAKDDYLIASELGHTAMVQAYCEDVEDGEQRFIVEWQVHYLPWQFGIRRASAKDLKAMLKEFDANGIEPVETMARWKWCKLA